MANKKLKGLNEFHVIFKFDTDEKATNFITKVKECYYSLEKTKASNNSFDNLSNAFNELRKNEPKTKTVKKPVPAKRKTRRPAKKNI